ncbi:MAG: OmcA/MtrC family decaheme c-type cytochrome [Sandaracinaceae bacterium]|nr:OmcA/MtrC family decaheme c-type cytochrome [Sandaracinaceae bacterium]
MTRYRSATLVLSLIVAATGCSNGSSCAVADNGDGTATITCEDGTSATVNNGADGMNGMNGMDGTSCSVADDGMGARVITCDDGTTVTVRDGVDGTGGGTLPWATGPGVLVEVTSQGVDADRHPFVELKLTDQAGTPLDREGALTEGAVSASFTIAHIPTPVAGSPTLGYISYITRSVTSADGSTTVDQATTDSGGTWTAIDVTEGTYRYVFGATLPDGYVGTETHRIGIYATRTYQDVRYVANETPTFRPDGMAVALTRDIVTNDACNQCHNPLSAHGGSRESVDLCVTCHGRDQVDPETGNSIDFEAMIHRIHRGSSLPSVVGGEPWDIVGYRGAVHDYSTVVYPRDIRSCETCHQGPDGGNYLTVPTRASCGSCHDDIWFEPGTPPSAWQRLHPGGDRPDDDRCTVCHEATGGLSPIADNHFNIYEQPDALDVQVTIDALSFPTTGLPTVDFTIMVNGAPYDVIATPIDRLRVQVAGPTTDYAFNQSFDTRTTGTLAARSGAGQFRYTLPLSVGEIATANSITATGTWAVGFEGRAINGAGQRYTVANAVSFVAITDSTAVPRRRVVEVNNCNQCHEDLSFHGGTRNDPNYCVFCHNPTLDTSSRMTLPAAGDTAVASPVNFAYLVHRLHTGENGANPYFEFDELRFPADRRECTMCHVNEGSYSLPLPATNQSATTRVIDSARAVVETRYTPPTTNACTGCHDSSSAVAHAETMTSAMGAEGCATCHAAGSAFGIDEAHARPEYDIRMP